MAKGDRVELDYTSDPWTRLEPGARGNVVYEDSLGTVHVNWDDGSRLGLVPGHDRWHGVDEITLSDNLEIEFRGDL